MSIPAVLHQIWMQGSTDLPSRYASGCRRWTKLHPSWQHILWDEPALDRMIADRFPEFNPTWKHLPHMIQRVDAAKMCLLAAFGGVYVDMDTSPLKPIDPLVAGTDLVLATVHVSLLESLLSRLSGLHRFARWRVNNAFIASVPRHPVFLHAISLISAAKRSDDPYPLQVMRTCGPEMLARAVQETLGPTWWSRCRVLPAWMIDAPVVDPESGAYVQHFSDRTWMKGYVGRVRSVLFAAAYVLVALVVISLLVRWLRPWDWK